LAMVTSGNGLELVHSKAAQRGGWVAFHLFLVAAMLFIPTFPGLDAWFATEFGRVYCALDFGIIIAVTLVSRTGRMFVHLFQWWLPVHLFGFWVGIVFGGLTTGNWAFAGVWGAVFSFWVMLAWFRPRFYLAGHFTSGFLAIVLYPLPSCVNYDTMRSTRFETYAECVEATYQDTSMVILSLLLGSALLVVLGYKLATDALAWRAARASREHHRALWREELSKVAASPEVMDGLRRLPHEIARELQEQRGQAVRSLGVVGRVMAFLNEHVGRWSLRGHRSKARQMHGDINLLFNEASMVNEPFLDLMASLVAGLGGVGGEEEASGRPALALKRGPIKKPDRALQKLVRVYGRDVAMLTDLVRCTVLVEDLSQVEALMATLDARSVVGLTAVAPRGEEADEEGDEMVLMSDNSDDERILRITAIKNRFDERYDDSKSGGYRDLSLSVEVLLPALWLIST
jgi:hypothetical protein